MPPVSPYVDAPRDDWLNFDVLGAGAFDDTQYFLNDRLPPRPSQWATTIANRPAHHNAHYPHSTQPPFATPIGRATWPTGTSRDTAGSAELINLLVRNVSSPKPRAEQSNLPVCEPHQRFTENRHLCTATNRNVEPHKSTEEYTVYRTPQFQF
eukprot:Selendium_serpulae@DN6464_c0_g1_i1.p1